MAETGTLLWRQKPTIKNYIKVAPGLSPETPKCLPAQSLSPSPRKTHWGYIFYFTINVATKNTFKDI